MKTNKWVLSLCLTSCDDDVSNIWNEDFRNLGDATEKADTCLRVSPIVLGENSLNVLVNSG